MPEKTAKDHDYSEDALIEKPAIALFEELGWQTENCYGEFDRAGKSPLGRQTPAEVVLVSRLRAALERLNPGLMPTAMAEAVEELTRDRSTMSMAAANREIYKLLKDGVKVSVRTEGDEDETTEAVKVIDWTIPANNDFFLASQFWISGEMYKRRADLVGFVNGLPLVFVELKAAHKRLEDAFDNNISDYKDTIPHIFWYNAFIIVSNGSKSKIGSISAAWEHFSEWKKINSEGEEGVISLETMIRGTCDPRRLLDITENFTLFSEEGSGLIKLVAKNHQYLGVNNAIDALTEVSKNRGKLGVFWHTQGSGKSYSMIFFSQKILRTRPGNWTFVVVTDRKELDGQIYKNFARAGVVTEKKAQADSIKDLRQLLREDHRFVFTLIQKFQTEPGTQHPILSDRPDIIVLADEAHRSQYDTMALNMRTALPNAAFIAFTGTPLMVGEEKTRHVFGDYVSIYNFKQSTDDRATVRLFYENRIPELQLTNRDLNSDMAKVLEEAALDEQQEKKLEREFSREYHLITRDDRLERIAEDIVAHFMGRGFPGKAMVVSIDKATAVKMYEKVRKHWKNYLGKLKKQVKSCRVQERGVLEKNIAFMEQTDMAVVVSQGQNEIEEMKRKGVDITPHRKRMLKEDLDEKFKDPKDPFRIVFVCAMWMTGFDVPCCSTIYLDKPMRNHTLMQAIARANRVFKDKDNGLIVDYVGVFRNLQKALAIYGSTSGGGVKEGETPVEDKAKLVDELRKAVTAALVFCKEKGVDVAVIPAVKGFDRVKLLDDAVEALLVNDQTKRTFMELTGYAVKLYKAVLPDPAAREFLPVCRALAVLADKIRSLCPQASIADVMQAVEELLDGSIAADGYVIREASEEKRYVDLSKIDFEALRKHFEKSRKRTEAERLRGAIHAKLLKMVRLNTTRMDYLQKFQEMIDDYNTGAVNVNEFFKRLVKFAQGLNEEEKRGIGERLSEEELAVFDLLTKPTIKLTKKEEQQVKTVAQDLLGLLKRERLVLDWRKRQQTRAAVQLTIEQALDHLPPAFSQDIFQRKCGLIYQHVYDSYYGQGKSVYMSVA